MRHVVAGRSLSVLTAATVGVSLVLAGSATGQVLGEGTDVVAAASSVPGNVDRFKQKLANLGFTTEDGKVEYEDLVKECCLGKMADTLANNPWPNAYMTLTFPVPPGSTLPGGLWQLGEDEAIVLVGRTPPKAAYFSYQTFLSYLPGATDTRLGLAMGDTINIATVKTTGASRADRPIVYVITGNRTTEMYVRQAATAAGYPAAILNVEYLSSVLAPLGRGAKGSWFYFAHRTAVPESQEAVEQYVKYPPYAAFRVTPTSPLGANPVPAPELRVRGTGKTEMDLYPALKRLRKAILDRFATKTPTELDTHVWWLTDKRVFLEKPFVGLQRGLFLMGATRDTNYLATYPNFKLRDDSGEFVIAYGVNHQRTGKATYSSVSLYADPDRWFGVGTMLSREFGDSARQYLPDDPDADLLYAVKVARSCGGEPYCLEIEQPDFEDINGQTYTCTPPLVLNDTEMFFIFRSYMEPTTKVSPDDNELLYDQAIHFAP